MLKYYSDLISLNNLTATMAEMYLGWSFAKDVFLAHLAKGHVSLCHHLASVIHPSVRHTP